MADSSALIKVALFGGAGFLAWKYVLPQFLDAGGAGAAGGSTSGGSTAGGSTSGSGGGSASGGSTSGGSTAGGSTSGSGGGNAPAYNSLAALLDRMTKAAGSAGWASKTPDEWNWLMVQQGGLNPAPDPLVVFGNREPMTLAQYWAGMSAWLATNKGLTGLGVYAGLARIAYGGRRPNVAPAGWRRAGWSGGGSVPPGWMVTPGLRRVA